MFPSTTTHRDSQWICDDLSPHSSTKTMGKQSLFRVCFRKQHSMGMAIQLGWRWFLIILDDPWWFLMILENSWWSLMILDHSWWSLMILDDSWWFLMILGDSWWFLMILDDSWWFLMILGVVMIPVWQTVLDRTWPAFPRAGPFRCVLQDSSDISRPRRSGDWKGGNWVDKEI